MRKHPQTIMKSTLLFLGLLAVLAVTLVPHTAAQRRNEQRVSAQLQTGVVRLGDRVMLEVSAEGTQDAKIVSVPQVEGLSIGSPGRPSVQQTFINRRSWIVLSWKIPVRPQREGDFEIPPVIVEVAGERVATRPLKLRAVRDLRGADLGFLEVRPSPSKAIEGQPITVELVFGWDQDAEVNYVNLMLPWWDALPGTLELEGQALGVTANKVDGVTVNDNIPVVVEQTEPTERRGRTFHTLRLTKTLLPARSGSLEFSTSFLEFGRRSQHRSFLSSRREKVERYFVEAPSFELEVMRLPSEGQPLDFSGAVGSIQARASADVRDVNAGDSIKLTVDWTGSGNLEFFLPPDPARLDEFDGFRVYGKTEEKSFERRRVVYDLAPLADDVTEIPAVPLSVYDVENERYDTIRTEPIRIRVRPLADAVTLGDEEDARKVGYDIRDIDAGPLTNARTSEASSGGDWAFGIALAAVPVFWLGLRTAVRRRHGDPNAPLERRRRRARHELKARLAQASTSEAKLEAFLAFLAARTRERDEAWIGREVSALGDEPAPELAPYEMELDAQLPAVTRPTLSDEDLRAVGSVLERLERSVYGGSGAKNGGVGGDVTSEEILSAAERVLGAGL